MKLKTNKKSPVHKTTVRKQRKSTKKYIKGASSSGMLYAVVLTGAAIAFSASAIGGVIPKVEPVKAPPVAAAQYACCDSGSGAACVPNSSKTVTYNGQLYGLLKSGVYQHELKHLTLTNNVIPVTNQRIFINNSDTFDAHAAHPNIDPNDCLKGQDLIWVADPSKSSGQRCHGIPNDELIYACTDTPAKCAQNTISNATPWDVYYRISDGTVPTEISTECPKPSGTQGSGQQIVISQMPGPKANLQLETFNVVETSPKVEWLGAWCKPAINLYPTDKTQVHVTVDPQGQMNYTDPVYPAGGWNVTAYPNGTIEYQNKNYPYLYWEAAIDDSLIPQPKTGYVVKYADLQSFFDKTVPQSGLNAREAQQFKDYWLQALPQSPYYFIGLMPQKDIDSLAPMTVEPKPDSLLRVSFYFKALDKPEAVTAPDFSSFTRKGFTVTEWGGFFKKDQNHPNFTCLM